jgi:hypothetical protein
MVVIEGIPFRKIRGRECQRKRGEQALRTGQENAALG